MAQQGIHPDYTETTFTCGCGAVHLINATCADMSIDMCSECHPFYTGKKREVDTAGRMDKFRAREAAAAASK